MPYGYKLFRRSRGIIYPLLQGHAMSPDWYTKASQCYCYPETHAYPIDAGNPSFRSGFGCGFYSFKNGTEALYDAQRPVPPLAINRVAMDIILAKIWAYGHVVEHEHGYRSEYIQLLGIMSLGPTLPIIVSASTWEELQMREGVWKEVSNADW
jgi:hypothetical protein